MVVLMYRWQDIRCGASSFQTCLVALRVAVHRGQNQLVPCVCEGRIAQCGRAQRMVVVGQKISRCLLSLMELPKRVSGWETAVAGAVYSWHVDGPHQATYCVSVTYSLMGFT